MKQLAGLLAAHCRRHGLLHIRWIEAVIGQRLAVGLDGEQWKARDLLGLYVGSAFDLAHHLLHLGRDAHELIEVVPVDLHGNVGTHARDQFVRPHLDRLGHLIVVARYRLKQLLDLPHQHFLGLARIRPVLPVFKHHEGVGNGWRHRIAGYLGGADLAEYALDLRERGQRLLQGLLHLDGLRQAGARNAQRLHRDVPFIEVGDELRTQTCRQQAGQHNERRRTAQHRPPVAQRPAEQRGIASGEPRHDLVLVLGHAPPEEQCDGCGHEREGQQDRPGERQHHRDRHRVEHLSLDAGQRKDREIDRGDDADAE